MKRKMIKRIPITWIFVLIVPVLVNGCSVERAKQRMANNSPRRTILQGKVVSETTGAPLAGYHIMVGPPAKQPHVFEGGPVYTTDKQGKFRVEVPPGRYLLSLEEMRAMTPQMARREAEKGRLWWQRAEWAEVTSSGISPFRKGNAMVVNIQRGEIRIFVFRFRPLD